MENKKQNDGISLRRKKIFAQNLRRYLDESGKLQKDIADQLGISQCSVSDWLKLRSYPRMNRLQQMAMIFGCEISDLIEEHSVNSKYYVTKGAKDLAEEISKDPDAFLLYQKIKALPDDSRKIVEALVDRLGGEN